MNLDDFGPIEPDMPGAPELTPKQRLFCEWITTPADLREPDEMTERDFCKTNGIKPSEAMRWKEDPSFRLARRTLSVEKGEINHRVSTVLEAQYLKATEGNTSAFKAYTEHYHEFGGAAFDDMPRSGGLLPSENLPRPVKEMTDEEIAKHLKSLEG